MELRQLEYFVAVAEERHFTRAAQRLHVAQSGLSATIKALEVELGARLLLRTTRRVELTQAGDALLGEARRTLASARAAADVVAAVEGLVRGELGVGVMQAMSALNLGGLLRRFHTEFPGVELRLRQTSSADLVAQVEQGNLDLAFTSSVAGPHPGLAFLPVFSSPMVVVCAGNDPLNRRRRVALSDLERREFVDFPVGWGSRLVVDGAFVSAGLGRRVPFEVNDVATLLDLVEAGLGIAVVPAAVAAVRPGLATVGLSPPLPPLDSLDQLGGSGAGQPGGPGAASDGPGILVGGRGIAAPAARRLAGPGSSGMLDSACGGPVPMRCGRGHSRPGRACLVL